MRIKIRTYLFLLFGLQGMFQVIYWELIKGYPACFMCKGYRVLYMSILITAILYRKRASFFRLLLLCGLITVETVWSGWGVIQKMGVITHKCQATAQIIEGKMIFVPCASQLDSWGKVLCSPVGWNALLSVLMLGYVVGVLWQLKIWRIKGFRWGLVLMGLGANENSASTHKDGYPAIQQAVNVQKNKAVEKDVLKLQEIAEMNAKLYEKDVRHLNVPDVPERLAETKELLQTTRCKGKCPSFQPTSEFEPSLQVCMSFSVPIQVWKDLNEDLIRHRGVFVVKGLPNNSFQAFAAKVLELRKQGITAPIRIDPKLFEQLKVNQVPLFVVKKKDETHTVSGTLTIPYVMDLMHIKTGETQ